jgi:hypothetical protein
MELRKLSNTPFGKVKVRIEPNEDETWSAYIYDSCVCNGTYEECEQALRENGESV